MDEPKKKRSTGDNIRAWRWKPGQSGNPKGRPKYKVVTDALRVMLAEALTKNPNSPLLAELVAEQIIRPALKGSLRHIKELLDRTEGKPRERMEVSGPDGSALLVGLSLEKLDERIRELLERIRSRSSGNA